MYCGAFLTPLFHLFPLPRRTVSCTIHFDRRLVRPYIKSPVLQETLALPSLVVCEERPKILLARRRKHSTFSRPFVVQLCRLWCGQRRGQWYDQAVTTRCGTFAKKVCSHTSSVDFPDFSAFSRKCLGKNKIEPFSRQSASSRLVYAHEVASRRLLRGNFCAERKR